MTTFDAAPGELAPGARPVQRFALRHLVSVHAWEDLTFQEAALHRLEERLVLDAFRKGFGLLERPERSVREMVWAAEGHYRECFPDERPEVYDVLLQAKAVRFDG